jgi:hypothetical protein
MCLLIWFFDLASKQSRQPIILHIGMVSILSHPAELDSYIPEPNILVGFFVGNYIAAL